MRLCTLMQNANDTPQAHRDQTRQQHMHAHTCVCIFTLAVPRAIQNQEHNIKINHTFLLNIESENILMLQGNIKFYF